jgi:protein involved in polysaccharide export with SLBB domain
VKPTLTSNNHPSSTKATASPASNDKRVQVPEPVVQLVSESKSNDVRPIVSSQGGFRPWGNAPLTAFVAERPRKVTATVLDAMPLVAASGETAAPSQVYRVGVGDVLDIQIPHSLSTASTLYTISEDGMLDYPLAGGALPIAGLTTEAIAARLKASIKVLDDPAINVKVRDYASHTVNIIGFVRVPGVKVLRREAVPLYVLLSEAMPLPEAVSAAIVRDGFNKVVVDLHDPAGVDQLVLPGDVIRVSGSAELASQFFYAGGEVKAPGQKSYHSGLTLTQAILASGGLSKNAGSIARISRQNEEGRLVSFEYDLRRIREGRIADPLLEKGDRIEVSGN